MLGLSLRRHLARFRRNVWRTILRVLDTEFHVSSDAMLTAAECAQIKELLQPGDILLESNSAYPLWQLAARFALGSAWMHGAMYVGQGMVVDAGTHPAVAQFPLDEFLKTTAIAVFRPRYATEEDAAQAIEFVQKCIGRPFNINFDHDCTCSFYCTQLISRALSGMPHAIHLKFYPLLWKRVVSPMSVVHSKDIDCLWNSKEKKQRKLTTHPASSASKNG
jgi:hypothetical protein